MGWKPLDEHDRFPTLGYDVADWMTEFLAAPDSASYQPFVPTQEQLEFLVDMYALDPVTGDRLIHRAVLSRSRGWGKSPFLAAIGCVEALGPVLSDGWDANGQPVGKPWSSIRTPLVLITATTDDQTANTWVPLLEMLRGGSAPDEYGCDPMDSFVALPSGRIECRTSSATSVKGARACAAVLDQTESWVKGNSGPRFARTLRNNATKLGGVTIESPNAFTIGENSVAETTAKFWDDIKKGKVRNPDAVKSLLYDHREAPLTTDVTSNESLIAGLRYAYGDSSNHPEGCVIHDPPCKPGWSPIGRIAADFWETDNDPEEMVADFLNQHTAASDSWVTAPEMRAIADLEKIIGKDDLVTLGFDGSEGRKVGIADSTALVGYSLTQKHLFKVGVWSQPDGPAGEGWKPPRLEIEQTVVEAFKKYRVVGFYADPSAGWAGDVKEWESRYHGQLKAKISTAEPIKWPQRNISNTCDGFAQLLSAIRAGDITYDASPELTAHFLNARRDPRRAGYVLKKADDNQDYGKIDAAWTAMFAYKAALDAIGAGVMRSRARRTARRIY